MKHSYLLEMMMIWCQLNLPLHGSWNNSMVELVLPVWEVHCWLHAGLSSHLRHLGGPDCSVQSSLYGTAQLGTSWSMWALILLQTYCVMLDTSQPYCWVCCAATRNWLQGTGRVCRHKVLLFRAVSLRACYPDLCLQNRFAPKQARSTPGCLNLLQFCLNWKIPLFLGAVCCKIISDIC